MKVVYFDNAATTPMYGEVVEVMKEAMLANYGNPSSTHQVGRKAKVVLETARKNIAKHLNVSANEIVFTSGGTEGNNLVLTNAVKSLEVKRIITSKIEHNAVINVAENLAFEHGITVDYVSVREDGMIDLEDLAFKLENSKDKTLVSFMLVNNEIGNVLAIDKVSKLCQKHNALFHSDSVQAVGHVPFDLKETPLDFMVASAHKFHGPKGIGFLYSNKKHGLKPMILGGNQEKGVRSGTENTHAILGMSKALDVSMEGIDKARNHALMIKEYFCEKLKEVSSDFEFNGTSNVKETASPFILNVRFPVYDKMLLFNLDLQGVMASSGSACQSGGIKVSHVLKEILKPEEINKTSIRFSFSKFSTKEEVDYVVEKISNMSFFKK